jgi:drug/metabolite transporter (DMT)-like permease
MARKRPTILLVVGVVAGLLGCALIFLNSPLPYPVLICLFLIAFACNAVYFVYTAKYMRDNNDK